MAYDPNEYNDWEGQDLFEVFLCPQCGGFHKPGYIGECRDDNHRWTGNELDDKFGPDGWIEVPEQGEQE